MLFKKTKCDANDDYADENGNERAPIIAMSDWKRWKMGFSLIGTGPLVADHTPSPATLALAG